jgi:hypothetical protein
LSLIAIIGLLSFLAEGLFFPFLIADKCSLKPLGLALPLSFLDILFPIAFNSDSDFKI